MPGAVYEYVAFVSQGAGALARLNLLLDVVKHGKHSPHDQLVLEAEAHLTVEDRARFWWPTPEEQAEHMEDWWATPLPERHLSPYLRTPWTLSYALIVTCECEYDLVDVVENGTRHHARFQTHGYPYGGPASLIALVEAFGHRVTGIDDGTGYEDYVPEARLWKSKRHPTE